jgi:hypothetical protein
LIYLILKLLWPVHFSWGVGEVLWTLVEFMLHGVDGVTAEERQDERKREGEEEKDRCVSFKLVSTPFSLCCAYWSLT